MCVRVCVCCLGDGGGEAADLEEGEEDEQHRLDHVEAVPQLLHL